MCCGLTVLFVSLAHLKLNLSSEFFLLEKIIIIINLFKKIFPMFYHFATLHYSCIPYSLFLTAHSRQHSGPRYQTERDSAEQFRPVGRTHQVQHRSFQIIRKSVCHKSKGQFLWSSSHFRDFFVEYIVK